MSATRGSATAIAKGTRELLLSALGLLLPTVALLWTAPVSAQPTQGLPPLTSEQILAAARMYAEHEWVMPASAVDARCVQRTRYVSDFVANDTIVGVAYDWGGMDSPLLFEQKLAAGQAAGSHSVHGVTGCTAGVDCSGFLSLVWESDRKYGTSTIHEIADTMSYNRFTDMVPGDALNKPGAHIVLFVGYRADGNPTVYEASGAQNRVVLNETATWARYADYRPIRYRGLVINE